jgi:carbonic anhydrase
MKSCGPSCGQQTGTASITPGQFHAFRDVEENLRQQIEKLRTHPWIPDGIPVRGFAYDVGTGRLKEVSSALAAAGD